MSSRKVDIDWVTLIIYLLLILIGWIAIYTADYDPEHAEIFYQGRHYGKQAIWIIAALSLAFFIQILDTRFFTAFAYLIYGFGLFMLVLTLIIGAEISGSKSWIRLGFFNLQTAEIAKFATCLAVAKYLSSLEVTLTNIREQLIAGIIIVIPMLLILLQGDAGSAIVFTSLILVLYREGLSGGFLILGVVMVILFILSLLIPFYYIMGAVTIIILTFLFYRGKRAIMSQTITFIVPVIAVTLLSLYATPNVFLTVLSVCSVIFLFLAFMTKRLVLILLSLIFVCGIYVKGVDYIYNNILETHQQNRIGVLLGTIEDPRAIGYNLNQSKIAIGSGGLWGKGFLEGTQNKGNFVPELSTDFIFCTIGEEFGFMGSLVLIGLFLALMLRIIYLAERQQSKFSRIYAYGVTSIIFFHFAVNIGMTIGLVPIIGIPLPFISYGGSSLFGFTVLLFILVKLDSERFLYLR
ncbi:MAG: rod shape-determining protein RodA [Chitinophagales bacterium]